MIAPASLEEGHVSTFHQRQLKCTYMRKQELKIDL